MKSEHLRTWTFRARSRRWGQNVSGCQKKKKKKLASSCLQVSHLSFTTPNIAQAYVGAQTRGETFLAPLHETLACVTQKWACSQANRLLISKPLKNSVTPTIPASFRINQLRRFRLWLSFVVSRPRRLGEATRAVGTRKSLTWNLRYLGNSNIPDVTSTSGRRFGTLLNVYCTILKEMSERKIQPSWVRRHNSRWTHSPQTPPWSKMAAFLVLCSRFCWTQKTESKNFF